MARPLRVEIPDGIYHVTARGNAKQDVFTDRDDYSAFLGIFRQTRIRFGWSCLGYCLIPNHYHLLLRTPRPNLSRGMRQLNGVYAQRFNRRHDRCGHLWQGRFSAVLVQADGHLFEGLRYLALNPVRAGLCSAPEEWPWSSHSALVGRRRSSVLDLPEVLGLFGGPVEAAQSAYAGLVREAAVREGPVAAPAPPIYGDEEFIRTAMAGVTVTDEHPVAQRCAARPSLRSLLGGPDCDAAILEAHREHGYRLREIAEALGCHSSTVSRRLRAAEAREADA